MVVISGIDGIDKVQAGSIQFDDVSAGMVIQVANYTTGDVATGTVLLPGDDTIPQITEGTQFMSLVFTPKKANSKLKIEVVFLGSNSTTSNLAVALFDGSTASIGGAIVSPPTGTYAQIISFTTFYQVVSIPSITFTVRAGPNAAATVTFNGSAGSRLLGGSLASSITITEIAQ